MSLREAVATVLNRNSTTHYRYKPTTTEAVSPQ
jgi:hypothetical protein